MPGCTWVEITHAATRWLVAPIYIAPVGIGQAERIAREHGCELPTPALVDAIWAAADLKLMPLPRKHDGTPRTMASDEAYADQAARIYEQFKGKDFRLLAGTHKDVAQSNGRVGLYGWHYPTGKVIQPFYAGHAPAWKDYSQGLRLVKRVTVSSS